MPFPKFTKTPVAVDSRSNIDLSSQHVTTADFMQFGVTKIMPLVPTQSVNIAHEAFMRMDPLPVPTFGRCNVFHRAFFVPMRTIFQGWDDFINDAPHYYASSNTTGLISSVPTLSNDKFCLTFLDPDNEFSTREEYLFSEDIAEDADFLYTGYDEASSLTVYSKVKLTALGRWSYKLLRSLGYNFNWTYLDTERLSLMPFLGVMRVYYDFYYPSQYINDSDSAYILQFLNRDIVETDYYITVEAMRKILKIMYNVAYSQDYFTSAWDNPVAPSKINTNDISIVDPTYNSSYNTESKISTASQNGTPILLRKDDNVGSVITEYALTALKNLSDYMRRHQIAGSRALDRYLSRWGVKLPNESLKRCIMIDEWQQELQFGDVTSTASTESAGLGYYAGKGISYGQGNLDFTCDKEYGYLIIVSTIIPVVQYYQGLNKHCQHITKLDFFTPEFDNLGTQAVASKELYCTPNGSGFDSNYPNRVFGFLPRYAEYKVPYSQLTGDLSLNSFDSSNAGWTLYRDIYPFIRQEANGIQDSYDIEHGLDFVMATDAEQYNRIFYNTNNDADHFKVVHTFRIKSSFPGKPLWDDYEFEHEDNAQKVTMKVNGTSVD